MILGIYGSGGLGREIFDLAREINANDEVFEKVVFINDFKQEALINNVEVFTFDEFKTITTTNNSKIIIAVGEPKLRQVLRDKVTSIGYKLTALIHPTAFVGAATQISDGVVIQFGSFISCNVKIETNVLVQPNASVGHDCVIGNDSVISSYVAVSGNCTIGERAYIGASVPVKENISLGADSIIGMGSVVLRDIPENVIALGNPARAMKNNESGRVFK